MSNHCIIEKTNLVLDEASNRTAQLKYILVQTLCECDGIDRVPVFGIKAELFMSGNLIDTDFVADITSSSVKCEKLMKRLAANAVTPVALKDVVEDFIANDVPSSRAEYEERSACI